MSLDVESPHQCKKFWECSKPSLIDSYKLQEGGKDRKIFVAFLTLSYAIRLPYWCTYYATCSTSWELAPLGMETVVVDAKEITTFWQVPFVCLSVNHFLPKKFKNSLVFSVGFLIPHELHSTRIWLDTKYFITSPLETPKKYTTEKRAPYRCFCSWKMMNAESNHTPNVLKFL